MPQRGSDQHWIWHPKSPFPSGPTHQLQKAFPTCLGSVQVSEDHGPLRSCHSAPPALFSLISVPFPAVTHSEQCSFSAMASHCDNSPALPRGLHVGVCWTCPAWCQVSKLGRRHKLQFLPLHWAAMGFQKVTWSLVSKAVVTLRVCQAGNFHLLQNGLAGAD